MVTVIPPSVNRIWDRWNIRGLILFSLSLQTFLILCAPSRKRSSRKFVIFLIWSSYLLADWTASFVVGLISNNQSKTDSNKDDEALLAFWAPFLLLHLGGPDTITAFALEDNALWLRHLIGLLFQVIATAYVFVQTIPENKLWVPACLMFLAGIVKYAERTRALYLASLGSFRNSMLKEPDPGPNYAKLMEEYAARKEAKLPTRIDLTPEPDKESRAITDTVKVGTLSDLEVIQYAFRYFNSFKGLIVDLIFSYRERNESRDFFLKRNSNDALKVIEVELNLIYEVLYTKVVVLHNRYGVIFRLLSFSSVSVALGLFYRFDKRGLRKIDVMITYALLFGAIALDFISFFMAIFSDWTVASLKNEDSCVAKMFMPFISLRIHRSSQHKSGPFSSYSKLDTPLMFRRWRESVSQFNLITYCLRERLQIEDISFRFPVVIYHVWKRMAYLFHRQMDIIIDYLGAKDFIDDWRYVSRQPFLLRLWMLIFDEMHAKSKAAESAEATKRICSARGSSVLMEYDINIVRNGELTRYIDEVAFDESLILWHLATELCYRTEKTTNDSTSEYREFSKLLSDYMLYLLVMLPNTMSAVAGIGEIRFKDTCAEAKKFFDRRSLKSDVKLVGVACAHILDVNTDVEPVTVKGDRSKSVLFDASILAKKLQAIGNLKWEIMTRIWIEMLGFAASHCRPDTHAQQVSKGGELITFVWLLMAHFGLGEQFQINEGHARAKLIVEK